VFSSCVPKKEQCLRLALSKGPNRVGVSPSPEDVNKSIFRNVVFSSCAPKKEQCLRLALSKGPNRIGPFPSPEDVNRFIFRNVVFSSDLESLTMDKVHKHSDAVRYSPLLQSFRYYSEYAYSEFVRTNSQNGRKYNCMVINSFLEHEVNTCLRDETTMQISLHMNSIFHRTVFYLRDIVLGCFLLMKQD
jgi:hypothetical protein